MSIIKDTFGELEGDRRKQTLYFELTRNILSYDAKRFFEKNRNNKVLKIEFSMESQQNNPSNISSMFVRLFSHFYDNLSQTIMINREFRKVMDILFEKEIISSPGNKA